MYVRYLMLWSALESFAVSFFCPLSLSLNGCTALAKNLNPRIPFYVSVSLRYILGRSYGESCVPQGLRDRGLTGHVHENLLHGDGLGISGN